MSLKLTTGDWVVIAGVSTVIFMVAMRWCMPTPKAKRQISFVPLGGSVFLLSSAVAVGYSASFTLYLYSCILLAFVVMLAPVGKRVAADTLEQEQKPWDKVPLNTFSLYWFAFSSTGCIVAMVYVWPAID